MSFADPAPSGMKGTNAMAGNNLIGSRWNAARIVCRLLLAAGLSFSCTLAQESGCRGEAASVPSRPTVASATDPTQCGVVELEYGIERQWLGAGQRHSDFSGGLRFGLLPNLDFHWFAGDYISLTDPSGNRTGFGDNWMGLKYRYLKQGKLHPSLGVLYEIKAPTGALSIGSSGKVDHQFAALFSKDLRKLHCDFNVIPQLIGRPGATGFDHNLGFALANWYPVSKRLTMVLEPYGYTALNAAAPGFASVMLGGSFQAHKRLYLDTGFDAGVSHFAPQKRVYGGITYAVGNAYIWLLPRKK